VAVVAAGGTTSVTPASANQNAASAALRPRSSRTPVRRSRVFAVDGGTIVGQGWWWMVVVVDGGGERYAVKGARGGYRPLANRLAELTG